jgi:ribosome-associated protein
VTKSIESERLAHVLVEIADSKQAEDPKILDMRKLVAYTDFLVIVTARNDRLARAIADEVRVVVKRDHDGLLPGGFDPGGDAGWTILDYLDCVMHVLTPEARDRYQLEDLWRDAPRLELELAEPEAPSAATG